MFARSVKNSSKNVKKDAEKEGPLEVFDPAKSKYSMDNEFSKVKDSGMPEYLKRNPEKTKAANVLSGANKFQAENPEDVKIFEKEEAERLAQ